MPRARLARTLVAVVVVLGAAAVGYGASLIWPLASLSRSKSPHTAQMAAARIEPAPTVSASPVGSVDVTAAQVASESQTRTFEPVVVLPSLLPSLAAEAKNLPDPAVLVKASLTDHAREATAEASTAATASTDPVVVTNSAKVEHPAENGTPVAEARTSDTDAATTRAAKANRRTVRIERRVRTTSGAPKMAQTTAPPASNYERVPVLKQFMTTTNKY